MADEHKSLKRADRAAESAGHCDTSAKVASESITDETRAPVYASVFKSFSGGNDKITLEADDPLAHLMGGYRGYPAAERVGQAVAEFAIEDKTSGKLITARGDRDISEPAVPLGLLESGALCVVQGAVGFAVERAKEAVGTAHGTVNFGVNVLSGIGNTIRMNVAAAHELHPIWRNFGDPDPEGTKMLHDTVNGVSTAARVMVQLGTTLNPISPFCGKRFDPDATDLTIKYGPTALKQSLTSLQDLAQSDTEHRAAVMTEAMLNAATLFVGVGELSAVSKLGAIRATTLMSKVRKLAPRT